MNKSIYERVLDLRNRISLDGDDTIYEQDHLLLDEVLDLIENIGGEDTDIETQINDYNNTVDIYNELEIGIKFKKQDNLLELYEKLAEHRLIVINRLLNEIIDLEHFDSIKDFIDFIKYESKYYGDEDTKIVKEINEIKIITKKLTYDELWDALVKQAYFTEEELTVITKVFGCDVETLNSAIYLRYGFTDYKLLLF